MTSLSRQKDRRAKFPPKNISFLITIPESSTKDAHLKVPANFVKKHQEKYRKQLSEVVYFKLPCGRRWEIEVTEKNGHFWFEKGWEKFSKYYSLRSHDKLNFRYEGDSIFKVHIFDHLAKTEIDYPIQETDVNDHYQLDSPPLPQTKNEATPGGKKDLYAEKNDKAEGETDHPIKCSNMQENNVSDHSPPASSPLPQTKKEATPSGGKNDPSMGKNEGDKSRPQRSPKPTNKVPLTMPSSAKGGQATALQRAEEFKSRNPYCFLVTMEPSYIKGYFLWLSIECSRNILKYLGIKSRTVGLRVVEGSKRGDPFTVELTYDTKRAAFKFESGWHDFARANELSAGDVCGLMLIDEDGLLFEVYIFRETVVTSPGIDEDDVDDKDDNGRHDANDDYAADENAPSSFKKVLPKYSMSNCLWLCSRFSRKYLSDMPSTAELRVLGQTWFVGLKYDKGTQRVRFQYNWTEFVKDNKLKIGDECEFMLTDENKPSFEVVIVSAKSNLPPDIDAAKDNCKDDEHFKNEDEDEDDDEDIDDDYDEDEDYTSAQLLHKRKRLSTKGTIKDVGVLTSTRQSVKRRPGVPRSKHSATGSDIALQKAKPQFTVVMTSSDVHTHYLILPAAFVKEHLPNQPSHVNLWGSNGMYWPVETQFSKGATSGSRWTEFVQRHNLKEGDECVFELTEKRKCLFDIHHCHTL